jgi:hypothetical protein
MSNSSGSDVSLILCVCAASGQSPLSKLLRSILAMIVRPSLSWGEQVWKVFGRFDLGKDSIYSCFSGPTAYYLYQISLLNRISPKEINNGRKHYPFCSAAYYLPAITLVITPLCSALVLGGNRKRKALNLSLTLFRLTTKAVNIITSISKVERAYY